MDDWINFGLLTALGSFPAFPADKDKDLPHGQSYNTKRIKSEIKNYMTEKNTFSVTEQKLCFTVTGQSVLLFTAQD